MLRIVQAISDDKFVGDFDARIFNFYVGEAAGRLVEYGADAHTERAAVQEMLFQMLQRQTGVDQILNKQDMAAADIGIDVFFDNDRT
ncbi:hypothetical protein D3C75_1205990 [compost metagenome]